MEECSSPIFHSLFSTLITFYIIVLLYFPKHLTQIAFSPVLFLTLILLITLLRLGSTQNIKNKLESTKTGQIQQNYEVNDPNFPPIEAETTQNPLFFSYENKINSTGTEKLHQNSVRNVFNFASTETNLNPETKMEKNPLFFKKVVDPLKVIFKEEKMESKINSAKTEKISQNSANDDQIFAPTATDLDPKTVKMQNPMFFSLERIINSTETEQTHQNSLATVANCNMKRESESKPLFYSFIDVKAPLEVIYEEDDELNEEIERFGYPLPLSYWYFSENDSDDSSSEEDFPANGFRFEWEKEEETEGLIEIELHGKIKNESFNGEDDNLIEIDIFNSSAMISL